MTCLSFLLIKFGDCGTTQKITIDNTITESITTKVEQTSSATTNASTTTINDIVFNNNGTILCGQNFEVQQGNTNSTQVVLNFNSSQNSVINTNMQNNVKSQLTQTQEQGLLNFLDNITSSGVKNIGDVENKIREALSVAVNQALASNAWDTTADQATITVNNNGLIEADGCLITQQNGLNVRVTNLTTSIQSNLQTNDFLNAIATFADQDTDSTLEWLKWIGIAAVALVGLIIIFVLLYFLFGGSKSKPNETRPELTQRQQLERRELQERELKGFGVSSEGLGEARVSEGGVGGISAGGEGGIGGAAGISEGGGYTPSPNQESYLDKYNRYKNNYNQYRDRFLGPRPVAEEV